MMKTPGQIRADGVEGLVRLGWACYSTDADVDRLVTAVAPIGR